MKRIEFFVLPALALLLNSCDFGLLGVPSLNPIYTFENTYTQPGIEGTWYDPNDSVEFIVELLDESKYELTVNWDDETSSHFASRLVQIDGETFLDLYPDMECEEWAETIGAYGIHALPCHVFAKISFEENRINLGFMSYSQLENTIETKQTSVTHALIEDHWLNYTKDVDQNEKQNPKMLVLTASIKELQDFVINNPELFTNEETLIRAD